MRSFGKFVHALKFASDARNNRMVDSLRRIDAGAQARRMSPALRGGSGAHALRAQGSMYGKIEEKLTAVRGRQQGQGGGLARLTATFLFLHEVPFLTHTPIQGLNPLKLSIVDNSHQHAGHAGVDGRK